MSDRVLRSQRETTQKVKENEETKAILRFHAVVDEIKTILINIDDFPGACSDKRINRRVSELRELKNTLDTSHNKLRSTAVSHVSATIKREADRLIGDLDTITPKFHKTTVPLVAKQLITDDHKNQSTPLSADSVNQEACPSIKPKQMGSSLNNEYMYDQRADSASINLTELSKSLAESFNVTRLPAPKPPIFSGDALEYHRWKCAFQTLIECKSAKRENTLLGKICCRTSKETHRCCLLLPE